MRLLSSITFRPKQRGPCPVPPLAGPTLALFLPSHCPWAWSLGEPMKCTYPKPFQTISGTPKLKMFCPAGPGPTTRASVGLFFWLTFWRQTPQCLCVSPYPWRKAKVQMFVRQWCEERVDGIWIWTRYLWGSSKCRREPGVGTAKWWATVGRPPFVLLP